MIFFFPIIFSSPIRFNNIKTSNNNYIIPICVEDKSYCYPFKISTSTNECLFLPGERLPEGLNPNSPKYRSTNVTIGKFYNKDFISGQLVINDLVLPDSNIILNKFEFILVNFGQPHNNNFKGVLGLGFDYSSYGERANFFALLNKKHLIDKPVFSYGKSSFVIGDDINLNAPNKLYKKCKIGEINDPWHFISCGVKAVVYKGKSMVKSFKVGAQTIRFNLEHYEIYVPFFFYNSFMKDILGNYLYNNVCIEMGDENGKFVECKMNEIQDILDDVIYLFIDKWNIKLKLRDLFVDNVLQLFHGKWNCDWIIGHILMDNNYVVVNTKEGYLYWNP